MSKITYGGLLIALAVGFGYILAPIPNVELVSLILSFSGFLLGPAWGIAVGGIGFFLYSLLNPFGIAPPPVLAAQVISGIFLGLSGSIYAKVYSKKRLLAINVLLAGFTGALFTVIYDILTNLGAFIAATSRETLAIFLIGGLSFSVFHIVSNTIIFAVLYPILAKLVPILRKPRKGKLH